MFNFCILTPRCSNGIHFISIVDFNISQSTFKLRWLCWMYTDCCLAFFLSCSWEGVVFGQRLAQVLSEVRALQQDTEPWRPRWGMTAWRVKHTFLNWALKKIQQNLSHIESLVITAGGKDGAGKSSPENEGEDSLCKPQFHRNWTKFSHCGWKRWQSLVVVRSMTGSLSVTSPAMPPSLDQKVQAHFTLLKRKLSSF